MSIEAEAARGINDMENDLITTLWLFEIFEMTGWWVNEWHYELANRRVSSIDLSMSLVMMRWPTI